MRIRLASFMYLPALALALGVAACGDNGDDDIPPVDARAIDATVEIDGAIVDAPMIDAPDIDAPMIDAAIDARIIDAPPIDAAIDATPIDAPIDAPPTSSELIGFARAAADGTGLTLPISGATITYIKPQVGSTTNDPAGFTIQAAQTGPALMIAVDPTTLTPAPAVGDVVSFTVTAMGTTGAQRRATAITGYARSATGTDINPLVQNVTAATDLLTAIDSYDSEVIDITGTITDAFASSGSGFERAQINTAGMTAADPNLQLRVPATFRAANDIVTGCTFTLNNVPVGRFNAQTQLPAFVAGDITLSACPAPVAVAATAASATSVQITFSRNILASSVMADGSQFTFDNGLTASAASVSGRVVTVTTSVQTNGAMYIATVANTVTDLQGAAIGTPNTAMFTAFMSPTHLVINELDHNQLGTTDTASFIEIYNPTPSPQPLANLAITFLNGNGNIEYGTRVVLTANSLALTDLPAGGYLVIRNSTVVVPGGVATIDVTGDFIQNGPDGIALINTSTNTLVDALSYGTPGLTAVTIAGFAATVSLVEGPTAFTTTDPNDDTHSLGRFPNGIDANMASTDWSLRSPATPGISN